MNTSKNHIDDLISRAVTSELDADESKELEQLLQSHPDRREEYEQLKRIWSDADALEPISGRSMEERWESLSIPSKTRSLKIAWISGVAASILIGLLLYRVWLPKEEVLITTAEVAQLHVTPDGSNIHLNEGSSIEYVKGDFSNQRTVLLKGEAFFEVQKGSPFKVKTEKGVIEILGTSFNIKETAKKISVVCVTGKVRVSTGEGVVDAILLEAGQLTQRSGSGPFSSPRGVRDASAFASWRSGKLYFEDESVSEVLEAIRFRHNLNFQFSEDFDSLKFTGSIPADDWRQSVKIISLATGYGMTISGNKVTFSIE